MHNLPTQRAPAFAGNSICPYHGSQRGARGPDKLSDVDSDVACCRIGWLHPGVQDLRLANPGRGFRRPTEGGQSVRGDFSRRAVYWSGTASGECNQMKRIVMALALAVCLSVPVFAQDGGGFFSDV